MIFKWDILPKVIHRLNAIFISISMTFFTVLRTAILTFIQKHRRPQANWKAKSYAGGVTISNFKTQQKNCNQNSTVLIYNPMK